MTRRISELMYIELWWMYAGKIAWIFNGWMTWGGGCSSTMNFFLTRTFLPLLTGIEAIKQINKTIEKGDPKLTLETLQSPEAKLQDVFDAQDYRYQVLLVREKNKKLEVNAKQNQITALFSNTTYFRWRCFYIT